MTKRTVLILAVVAVAAILAGCSSYAGANGNPSDLAGTWNGAKSSSTDVATSTVAGGYEGTWTSSSTTYPANRTYSTATVGGVLVTTWTVPANETRTQQIDITRVIASDGGYVETTTTTTTVVGRDALVSTASTVYVGPGIGAITGYTDVYKTVKTVTVTQQTDKTYLEKFVNANTDTLTLGGTTTITNTSSSSYNTAATAAGLSFYVGGGSWARGASTVSDQDKTKKVTDYTYALVIAADGAYTSTTVQKTTIAGKAADTQTITSVETGTLTGYKDATDSYTKGYTYVTFNKAKTDVTFVGTGAGVNTTFPLTADSVTITDAGSTGMNTYYITKGSTKTVLQISGMGYPVLTLAAAAK